MKTRIAVAALLFAGNVCAFNFPVQEDVSPKQVVPKTSFTTDHSDPWWNSDESGWGMYMAQQADFAFATLFVYGTDTKPTWATAQLSYQGSLTFSGPLYLTTGPWFGGGTFNPNAVGIRPAGTLTFTSNSINTATITYSIDGVTVTKSIRRQLLKYDDYNGTYNTNMNLTQSACTSAVNGSGSGSLVVTITQSSTTMTMRWVFPSGDTCNYNGTYSQAGKMGQFTGNYTCSDGEVGTLSLIEMTNRIGMVSGRLTGGSTNIGCQYTGRFAGVNPNVP